MREEERKKGTKNRIKEGIEEGELWGREDAVNHVTGMLLKMTDSN